jgi:hypothetical protein
MVARDIKNLLTQNAKNVIGWKTKRKIVVISVDDYGNVRLDSKQAREKLDSAGMKINSVFDACDALENTQDLEMLYDVLSSVKDKNGRHAVFTPFAVPCNINYEKMSETGYKAYYYELLPETFSKLKGYEGTWALWQEGIDKGLMAPQFHGREHLNLKVFEEKLAKQDVEVLTALKNRSYTSISSSGYPTISVTAAFDFDDFRENERFNEILRDGLEAFEQVFGYRADYFNPPAGGGHPVIHEALKKGGIRYIDTPMIKNEHQGSGKYKRIFNYTGKKNHLGQIYVVRNVIFEPVFNNKRQDWIDYTLYQVEAAFRWNRPAIISSHRVNYVGHIDPENRKTGVLALKELLRRIVRQWPEVEFMAANELGSLISNESNKIN